MEIEIGCDVSKKWVDVQILEPARRLRVGNSARDLERLARELPQRCFVGMEATGTMHELLAETLCAAGHTVYVLNPRWVHRYAQGIGVRGKTDRGDALVIARFIHAERSHLHPFRPPTAQERELRFLLHRRAELMKLRTATGQSLGEQARPVLQMFTVMIKDIDRRIGILLKTDPQWKEWVRRLKAIPGVGPLVVAHLIRALASRAFKSVDAFIAHTGLDPRPNDSGSKRGRRRLTHHGDGLLRSALFMAALSACKVAQWRNLYERYRAKGLPSTAALVAVARKIARIAFSLAKTGALYDPQHLASSSA